MRAIHFILGCCILYMLQSCFGGSDNPTLSTAEDLVKAEELFKEHYTTYDGKLTSVYFGTDNMRGNVIDIIGVQILKDGKLYDVNYTGYSDIQETEYTGTLGSTRTFSISDVDFAGLKGALDQAAVMIQEKDKAFHTFRISKASYGKEENGQMAISFDVMAKNPGKPYFGKRRTVSSDDFEFSFTKKGDSIVSSSGLDI